MSQHKPEDDQDLHRDFDKGPAQFVGHVITAVLEFVDAKITRNPDDGSVEITIFGPFPPPNPPRKKLPSRISVVLRF